MTLVRTAAALIAATFALGALAAEHHERRLP